MEQILVPIKTMEMVDSLLVNLANEGRHYDKTRKRVLEALQQPKKYAVEAGDHGDLVFHDVLTEICRLGHRPINDQQHISRIGFNAVGIIFGNWVCWTSAAWEEIGYTIIDSRTFLENPKKYIPKKYSS
jgi:hypothetical protein